MGKRELSESELRAAAAAYLKQRTCNAGGIKEAGEGLIHKTIPVILGWGRFSLLGVFGLLARFILLAGAASVPIFIRKAISGQAGAPPVTLVDLIARLDSLDYILAGIAIAATFAPRVIDKIAKQTPPAKKHLPFTDLTTAIEQMPAIKPDGDRHDGNFANAVLAALNSTLRALREEMAELVDDLGRERITEATLLVFDDDRGDNMVVKARTASNEPTGRPVKSYKFLAYYAALLGRPFVEHDFLSKRNPFQPVRLTVKGSPPVEYRSVLYLPIMYSEIENVVMPTGIQGAPSRRAVDKVMGVICVHCAKPYRFWRFGDHRKPSDGFGTVAYARALPYIALVTRLIERDAPKIRLENQ